MKNPHVLILGINGMTGESVFNYLNNNHKNIYGTTRQDKSLKLRSENVTFDLAKIVKKLKQISFIINCIAVNKVDDENKIEAINTNTLLPIKIGELSGRYKYKVIHISTDAVFNESSGRVNEKDKPTPEGLYAVTKYLGENNCKNLLNVRTSLIGLSPIKKNGLIESVLSSSFFEGYTNELWSGCTTLQFAKFCEDLIYDDYFSKLREKSHVLHFAPLGPVYKYELASEIIKQSGKKIDLLKRRSSSQTTRFLSSVYLSKNFLKAYETKMSLAVSELFKMRNDIEK